MGNTILKCDFCQEKQTKEKHILIIKSFGKHSNKKICFDCLKKKITIIERYEQRSVLGSTSRHTNPVAT